MDQIHLYSLTDPAVVQGKGLPPGISGTPVVVIAHGAAAAVISEVEGLPSLVRRRDLELHDTVNRVVLDLGVCLPLRYGTMLASREECVAFLAEHAAHWTHELRRLHGRVELSMRALFPAGTPGVAEPAGAPTTGPGTDYLRRRQAELAAGRSMREHLNAIGGQLHGRLEGIADAVLIEGQGRLLSVAALLPRDAFSQAAAQISTIMSATGAKWHCGQPWPPYSFVETPSITEKLEAPGRQPQLMDAEPAAHRSKERRS